MGGELQRESGRKNSRVVSSMDGLEIQVGHAKHRRCFCIRVHNGRMTVAVPVVVNTENAARTEYQSGRGDDNQSLSAAHVRTDRQCLDFLHGDFHL